MPQIVKTIPTELKADATYALRIRSVNAFGAVSDWSETIIVDTSPAGLLAAGRLVIGANSMTAYDNNGQMTFNYSSQNVIRTNKVTNPSFESVAVGTAGWTAESNTTISRITSDFFVGQPGLLACLKVTAVADGIFGVGTTSGDAVRRIAVSPGTSYTGSIYVRVPSGQPDVDLRISFRFYSIGGVLIKQVDTARPSVIKSTSNWVRLNMVSQVAPSGSAYMSIVIKSFAAVQAGSFWYLDGVIVEATSILQDYFDGSTSAGTSSWTGTVNDSTSTLDNNAIYSVNGGVFTSPTLQTSRTAATTGGVIINSTGLKGYNTAGVPTFDLSASTATLTINQVQLGKDVGPTSGYDGLVLTKADFNNIFIRRQSDGVVFFRVNSGGSNSITYDSSSGILAISGAISGGTIDIGGADTTSFHVDAAGNMWTGSALLINAPMKVTSTGDIILAGSTSNIRLTTNGTTAQILFDGANANGISSTSALAITSPNLEMFGSFTANVNAPIVYLGASNYISASPVNGFQLSGDLQFPIYGGGWYMQDTTYIRAINDKQIYTGSTILAGTTIQSLNNVVANVNSYAGNAFAFTGADTDTYIYHPSDGVIGLVSNGVEYIRTNGGTGQVEIASGIPLRLRGSATTDSIRYNSSIDGIEIAGNAIIRLVVVTNTRIFDLQSDGWGRSASGWGVASSISIKKNIQELDTNRALQMVTDLRPVTYDLNDDTANDQIGFIAEWTAEVVPHAVNTPLTEESIAGIDYGKFTPILTKTVQYLLKEVEELKRKVYNN